MNKSKDKGSREERAVVDLLRSMGYEAQRTLEAGARSDGTNTYDIDWFRDKDGAACIGECKVRKDGFALIYRWLGENDFLTIRADRKERLYVLPERFFVELIKK